MRVSIGLKIFGIALALLILMAAVALLGLRMTRTVDDQLAIIEQNYFRAYVALAQANIRSVEESAMSAGCCWRSPNPGIMPRNSISCASKPRKPARQATNGRRRGHPGTRAPGATAELGEQLRGLRLVARVGGGQQLPEGPHYTPIFGPSVDFSASCYHAAGKRGTLREGFV